uniref:ParB N-terminal domain-containing protein n=1 Tax=uncultured Aquimonas sp. TaxID=385483 RepID=UPI002620FC50
MQITQIPVANLTLDSLNPRLPEHLINASEAEIIRHLRDGEALSELAQSFADNGYFETDPLVVVNEGDRKVVVEGNRRLATLKIILGLLPELDDVQFSTVEFPPDTAEKLSSVPCFVAANREEVTKFIGFRHIGGLRLWPPEAKARFVFQAVEREVSQGTSADVFKEVGRQTGSNAQGVRNLYVAIYLLKHAREEWGIDVSSLQSDRFGVWQRALSSQEIKEFIGLRSARDYTEVRHAVHSTLESSMRQVIADLSPKQGGRAALIRDSRVITDYGSILADPKSYALLRETNDFREPLNYTTVSVLPGLQGH